MTLYTAATNANELLTNQVRRTRYKLSEHVLLSWRDGDKKSSQLGKINP